MFKRFSYFQVLPFVMVLLIPAAASAASSSNIISDFMCPCGDCEEPLVTCDCPQADGYRTQILDMMGKGYTQDQIVQDFVGRFGDSVLADKSPSSGASGFNVNRRTIGFLLLGSSLLLIVFLSGRYMGSRSSSLAAVKGSQSGKKAYQKEKKADPGRKHRSKDDYDEMLDDYKYD